jgi:hypothetical protein
MAHTSYNNVVDESRKWGNAADEKGNNSTPVGAELGRVSVDAVEIVHIRDGDVTLSDNEVAATQISICGLIMWGSRVGLIAGLRTQS